MFARWYVLFGVAFVLTPFLHPGLKDPTYFVTRQMFVSLTMFTEALSLVSQLEHMRKSMAVEGLNQYYLVALFISRSTRIFFWYSMAGKLSTFWYLILADVVHSVMVIGFFYRFRVMNSMYGDMLGFADPTSRQRNSSVGHKFD